ncbi:hypothetical protein Tco_0605008, partial [Tanacetum coccineum]
SNIKESDTGSCSSGTNVEFVHKQSTAPDATLDLDDSSVPFEFDDGDTGASFEVVDDHTGAPSEAVDDHGRDKIIEEDNIVKNM